jgi:hypothetical protein
MAQKRISGRQLRHGSPEETLSPGGSVQIHKRNGKVFELKRIDAGARSLIRGLDRLLAETPVTGATVKTNLARIIIEDRE